MASAWLRRFALTALLAGTTAGLGCAGERDEINRVQPLAIKKADLIGDISKSTDAPEFYMRSLITEVQRTNPWFSDGLQDLTRRIRFEINEDFLVARNAFEYIKNSDGKGGPRGRINNGPVVGKWRIISHFDIRKGYNPQTGELSNIVEENTIDRPWQQREFMRVDWSQNLSEDPNQIFWYESFSGDLKWTNLRYAESDKASEDVRSNFDEIHDGYFDVTSRWVASPETFDYYGYAFPTCFMRTYNLYQGAYNADPSIDCNDQEVTLRTGFYKIPKTADGRDATDYEVAEVTKWQGNIMGNLTMDRSGYDRQYGIVDNTWRTFIMRYNIWDKSHVAADCGNEPERTEAAANETCAAANVNSYCDRNVGKCTIPYVDRKVRPVAFFMDQALPERLHPDTLKSMDQWNVALKRAVSYARESECRKAADTADGAFPKANDDGVRAECHRKYFDGDIAPNKEDVPTGDDVVVVCHNPVKKGDNAACGPEGKKVRKGDIRHHMIAWWQNPSFNRPLGVIVWSGDPITGENIGSTVNIFGASVETYSARARDQIMLTNGDLTPSEYVSGVTQSWYANDNSGTYPADAKRIPELDAMSVKFKNGIAAVSPAEAKTRIDAVNSKREGLAAKMGFKAALDKAKTTPERLVAYNNFVAKQATQGAPGFGARDELDGRLQGQMEKLKKGGFEPKLMNDLWLSSVGVDPKFANEEPVKRVMSPLDGMGAGAMARTELAEQVRRKNMHMCALQAPEFLTFSWMSGFSAKLKAKYADGTTASGPYAKEAGVEGQIIDRIVRGKLIYQELSHIMYEDTLLHEVGHLMSMEHDFSGTWDAHNFHPEYWQLRANGSQANMAACPATGRAPGSPDNCMGPRWLDPRTPQELGTVKGQEHDAEDSYALASIMDYKFDALHEARLGQMDKMAAKFIYTRMVELVDDEKYSFIPEGVGKRLQPSNTLMNSESWFVVPGSQRGDSYLLHYTEMGRLLNTFDPRRCRPQEGDEKDRGIGQNGVVCAPIHKDHAFLRDTVDELPSGGFPEDFRVQYSRQTSAFKSPKYRWPYKVSDGRISYFHNYVYDNGADIYEITLDLLDRYEMMYLDYFYRKNSRERSVNNAGRAMYSRFFDRVQALQWNTLSDVVRNGGLGNESGLDEQASALSLTLLFDAMAKSLLRPQPGDYVLNKQPGALYDLYSSSETPVSNPAFKLGAGESRYVDYQFDLTKQFDYRAYAFRSGSFLEKPFASIALTDARPQLSTVARETYLDGRNVMYSFRSAIPEAFDRLIAGIMADDWDTVGPYIDTTDPVDAEGTRPLRTLKLWETDPSKITRPSTARIVDPLLGFRVKVPTMILMLLYQPIDSNMELIQRTRISVAGGQEQVNIPVAERAVFFDPVDGVEWNARMFGTEVLAGKIVDKGIGARMIAHANELLAAAYVVDTEPVPGSTNGQIRVKYTNGRPSSTAPAGRNAVAAEKLRSYVAFLNQVRAALYYLGFGSCGRGEEC